MPSKKKKYNARFPPARIKKIMQTDEDVGKVAAAVPVIISRALELFIESLILKTSDTTKSRNAKTLSTAHIKHTIQAEKKFDFLKDLVANVPDVQQGEEEADGAGAGVGFTSPVEPKPEGPRPRGRPRKKKPEGDGPTPPSAKRPRKRKVRIEEDNEETDSATEHDEHPASEAEEEMEDEDDEEDGEEEDEDVDNDNTQDSTHSGYSQDAAEVPSTSRQGPARDDPSQSDSDHDSPSPKSEPKQDTFGEDQNHTDAVPASHRDVTKGDLAVPRTQPLPPTSHGYFHGMFAPPPTFYGNRHFLPPFGINKEGNMNNGPDSVNQRESSSPINTNMCEPPETSNSKDPSKPHSEPKSKKRKNHSKETSKAADSKSEQASDPDPACSSSFGMFRPPAGAAVPMTTGYFPMPGVAPPMPPYMAGMPMSPFHHAMMGYPRLPMPSMVQPPLSMQGPGLGPGPGMIPPYAQHISRMMDPRYRIPGMNAMPSSDSSTPKVCPPEGAAHPHPASFSAESGHLSTASKASDDDNYDS